MIKKHEMTRPDSCLNQSQDDEPIFVICARDPLSAEIINEWAVRYLARKSAGGETLTQRQATKYHEALNLAKLAEKWRLTHDVA